MFAILLCLLGALFVGIAANIVAFASPRSRVSRFLWIATGSSGLVGGLVGVLGYLWGRSRVHDVLAVVDPAMREEILRVGMAECQVPLVFGGIVTVFGLLLGAFPAVRFFQARAAVNTSLK